MERRGRGRPRRGASRAVRRAGGEALQPSSGTRRPKRLPQAGAEEASEAPQAAVSKEPMKEKTPRGDWALTVHQLRR
jgi:hypothetical protein